MMANTNNAGTAMRASQRSNAFIKLALEWVFIILVAYFYSGKLLLNFDVNSLQQTGEHNESATLPLLAEIGMARYGEIPLWNPYMLTGIPVAGDFLSHFWNPISTIAVMLWGGINGMKVSIFLSFIIAGLGQWMFAYIVGLRRMFRIWSAILFMISGGMAMLWRVGWYELFLGAAWFPWCFALYLHCLQKQTWASIILTSVAIFMVISMGGGYYPIYLLVSMLVLSVVVFLRGKSNERIKLVKTAMLVVLFSAALSAVVIIPYIDGYHYLARDVAPDQVQYFSQPIEYGLINYIIYTPDWFNTSVLGTGSGWNWFYIGWLPIAALAFVSLAFKSARRQRWYMLISGVLFLILIMWFANQYSPFKKIYEWIPFLYNFRFPSRLLIIATSPLLILSAQALEFMYRLSRVWVKNLRLIHMPSGQKPVVYSPHYVISLLWIIGLLSTTKATYDVNKGFAFADQTLNAKSFTALNWLKEYDPSLYYVNIGGGVIYWDWMPAAYLFEMPVINFDYSRQVRAQELQRAESSPFIATAKYQISLADQTPPQNSTKIREFDGIFVWSVPDTLPYAFSVQPNLIQEFTKLTTDKVTAAAVSINGPNQVVVKAAPKQEGDVLVALMSYYPGWRLLIDGKPAKVTPYNGYLGSKMPPGEHLYKFYFLPTQYIIGASISAITFLLILFLLFGTHLKSTLRMLRKS